MRSLQHLQVDPNSFALLPGNPTRGGFGDVFRASMRLSLLPEDVAVKRIRVLGEETQRQRKLVVKMTYCMRHETFL